MLSLKIALRYLLSKKSHGAVNIISAISVAGVAVATAAIVVVLSVFNGFNSLARLQFSHIDPDLLITPATGKVMANGDSLATALTGRSDVTAAVAALEERALLISGDRQAGVVFTGVGKGWDKVIDTEAIVLDGMITDSLPADAHFAAGSDPVPAALAVGLWSRMEAVSPIMTLYVPRRTGRINPANPAGAFEKVEIFPTALLQTDRLEYDGDHIIIPIDAARRLLAYTGSEATGIQVALREGSDPDRAAVDIGREIGKEYIVSTRERQQGESFHMIAIEKWVTFMMLVFILLIATFNIISTLSLMVIEKRDNMTTLRFLGATRSTIRRIFVLQGILITLAGGILGTITGLALSLAQQWGGFIKLNGDASKMTISVYPVEVELTDLAAVIAIIFIISLITGQITRIFTRKFD
ncbi:MAG: FtsX-like permease family protein [Odoribacter sp.]|nr:FtsX-like permease family protein [Odoribacter sp.]